MSGRATGDSTFLDADSGEQLWAFDTGADIITSPAIAGGRVVVGAYAGLLYVFG